MNKYTRFAVTIFTFLILLTNTTEAAWTAPTATPPENNTSAPINVSGIYQTKLGGLGLGGILSALGTANRITSPKFCLNADGSDTNCVSGSWPTGGGTGGTNYWSLNGSALYNNTGSVIGINNSNPNTGSLIDLNGNGKTYGLLSQNAAYGVYGQGSNVGLYGYSGSYGVYGYGGSYGVYGGSSNIGVRGDGSGYGVYGNGTSYGVYGQASNSGGAGIMGYNANGAAGSFYGATGIKIMDTSNSHAVSGTKILASLTTDGNAKWYTPAQLGLGGGTSGGITGSGTGWTIPVFGGSAGANNQTTVTNSPITVGYSSAFQDISTMVVKMFPSNLWGTKTNVALDVNGDLNINGQIKIVDGTQGSNKILTSYSDGLATWRTASELNLMSGGTLSFTDVLYSRGGSYFSILNTNTKTVTEFWDYARANGLTSEINNEVGEIIYNKSFCALSTVLVGVVSAYQGTFSTPDNVFCEVYPYPSSSFNDAGPKNWKLVSRQRGGDSHSACRAVCF